jgi:hypothetical protein
MHHISVGNAVRVVPSVKTTKEKPVGVKRDDEAKKTAPAPSAEQNATASADNKAKTPQGGKTEAPDVVKHSDIAGQ